MVEWSNLSSTDIRMKMETMSLEYENLKNKINSLITEMDNLDIEYNNAKKELERRKK